MIDDSGLYRELVEASNDGLWLLTPQGATLYANPRMAELLGRTPEEMARLSAYDVHDEPGKLQFAEHLRLAAAGDQGHEAREAMYLRPDGTPVWLLVRWRPVRDEHGDLVGFLHQYSDYTELRHLMMATEQREQLMAESQAITGIGSWEWDVARDETRWSDQLYVTYGVDRDYKADFAGYLALIHPEDREMVQAAISTVFEGADEFDFTARVIRRNDGQQRWCHGIGRVVRDEQGRPVRVIGTNQDVTEQLSAQQEVADYTRRLGLLRQVAEAANESTSLVDTLHSAERALGAAPGWRALAAFGRETDDGPLSVIAFPADPLPWDQPPDPDLATRCWDTQQVQYEPLPGHETTHSLVAIPIMHGEGVASVLELVCDEVPPDEVSQDLISQVANQLGRVAERERAASQLAEARDQAMVASRLKSEFLATMSHEIRTPLNGVIGLTELLQRTDLDQQQRRLVHGLHGAGLTLRGLINDILDLSKIEAGKLELELVDFEVRAVVEQTMLLLRNEAEDKGLDLQLQIADDVPAYVRGDAVRWGQVITNIGSNAVKFTDAGRVRITVEALPHEAAGPVLAVTVTDTGPGIPEAARAELFDAFTQADPSTTRRHGGTGLGLTISQQLVTALGGELTLESELGQGSTFRFTAAFRHANGDALAHERRVERDRSGDFGASRVLVVEDNQVNQMVAVGLLEADGFTVDVASDGVEAVRALSGDHPYDAVLMDCRMPNLDGFEATRAVRAQEPPGTRVPIIAMTASALQGERERCLAAGMDDYLTKPVDAVGLTQAVRRWTEGADGAPGETPTPAAAGPDGVVDVDRIEMLHAMVKDGVSLFQRSSGNFLAHAEEHLAAVGASLEAGDADQLMATAHKLKGSALNLGLPGVGTAAFELEERGRTGRLDGAEADYQRLAAELERAVDALGRERAARS